MKVAAKRLLCLTLAFALAAFSLQSFEVDTYAAELEVPGTSQSVENSQKQEEPEEPDINREEAKDIAEFQVEETLENQETEWKEGTTIRKVYNLYNEKEEISAYAVELKNGTKDAGYVVVGAVEENPPIIEFRTSGRFLDEGLRSDEYLLYDGGISYYKADKDTKEATNIETDKEHFSLDDIEGEEEESGTESEKEEIQEEWAAVRRSAAVGGSNPPTNKNQGANETPYLYENGYTSVERVTVPDTMCYTYFNTNDLKVDCVPTAICNLLKYYTDRKRLKSSLLLNNDWNQTANYLSALNKDYGQGAKWIKPVLDRYFKKIDVQDATTHYYGSDMRPDNADWPEMKRRIEFGEPFIYNTCCHYLYYDVDEGTPVNHAVLAVGYLQYNYQQTQASGLKESRYLQMADGWTKRTNRYINVHVGNIASHDDMVTLYFVYTYIQK